MSYGQFRLGIMHCTSGVCLLPSLM